MKSTTSGLLHCVRNDGHFDQAVKGAVADVASGRNIVKSKKHLENAEKLRIFAKQNEKENGKKGTKAGLDNGRTVGGNTSRGLLGKQPQGGRVHQTIAEASATNRGDNSLAEKIDAEAGIKNTFIDSWNYRQKETAHG
jgi:hypothetical protein